MRLNGACHCTAVRFTVELPEGLAGARRCDCSFCAMRGAVAVTAPLDGLTVTHGADRLTRYTFNTGTAQHHFCAVCGIYTHHRRRSNPNEYGVNLACLEGQTPFLPEVQVMDGRAHPSDGGPDRVAGVLRFTPAEAG
ncbi:GFA family protein [Rhodobacteraceae bacterium 2CG4]|uniref:GFA family protein n=1 Tax=Halovulum marinum TaxID=2662447 RepID=A0A6L5YZ58_9RHOB|nr:GFA family protein [Halovulum marinum]MSU89125.1 GFA family protein [Halovulum marinum]